MFLLNNIQHQIRQINIFGKKSIEIHVIYYQSELGNISHSEDREEIARLTKTHIAK